MRIQISLAALVLALSASSALATKITIVTPYLAQPGTQYYVEAFQEVAKQNGWTVNVVDTKGDIAGVISRIEDAANQKVDAIVLNANPAQVTAGLETAKQAGVPVFGMDAGSSPLSSPTSRATATRWRRSRRPMSSTASTTRAAS